jgi:diguanylate cyclase
MTEMIVLLKNTDLFSKLKNEDLEIIADNSENIHLHDGEMIFSTGAPAHSLYAISEGEVRIVVRSESGDGREIAHFIKGEIFGELDLFENTERTADAIAESGTVLLAFPKHNVLFTDILAKYPEIFARIVYKFLALVAGRIRFTNKLVSEKASWIEDLRRQILYDNLTGLYNRSFLAEDFKSQVHNYGEFTSLLAIKPDNFKTINDNYGHEAGDKALRLLADTVKSRLKSTDIAVRYRGDELVAILPGCNKNAAMSVAEDLLLSISEISLNQVIPRNDFRFTTSIGLAIYPFHTNNPEDLLNIALEKMFDARNDGGNKIISA